MCVKKQFTQKSNLSVHLKIHIGKKNFVCNICEKSFTQKCALDQHLKVHTGEKPHQCKVCQKSFSEKGNLNKHMVVHTKEKPYSCEWCKKSYAYLWVLKKHKKKCQGQSSSQQNETTSTSEIQFVDCGETMKQEIKEESDTGDEINTLDDPLTVNSEHCQDIVVSSEISLESELEAESIDCKEKIKLEIKQEMHE